MGPRMTTTGTYNFNPGLGELGLYALAMVQVPRPKITAEHMVNMRIAANLVLSEWSSRPLDLWEVALASVPLTQNISTYSVPSNVVMMLDAYIETPGGVGGASPRGRVVTPIGRSEYAAYPQKKQQGPPTVYWFDRILAPTFTLWPVPDAGGPYTLNYYYVSRGQDAEISNGLTVDVPFGWLRAFASALAAELSVIYLPEAETVRRADAERSFNIAAAFNVENVPFSISPDLSGYFRK